MDTEYVKNIRYRRQNTFRIFFRKNLIKFLDFITGFMFSIVSGSFRAFFAYKI